MAFFLPILVRAQELKLHPTPFTVYLDFAALAASNATERAFPIWLESFEIETPLSRNDKLDKTTFRLRFRKFAGLNSELMLRLFFDDTQQPTVSGWNEIGACTLPARTLGQGLGLPTSETLLLPMTNVDYLDIEVAGDGSNVHAALLSSVTKMQTKLALDFVTPTSFNDPFDNAPSAAPGVNDSFLYGRVKATLEKGIVPLSPEAGANTAIFDFALATLPKLAVITFEILNADISAPPEIVLNNADLGPAIIVLPDLADPAFKSSSGTQADPTFHYAGWLKCQKVVAASALQTGANSLIVKTPSNASPVAIRAIEVQLKYDPETP